MLYRNNYRIIEMEKSFKISIAICTYNGEKYLKEQLDSFVLQSRLPDEIVICDDCSKDETPIILKTFAENAPFPVKLYFNDQNIGYIKNFEKAISLCQGDIIVLSDQDDVWKQNKLELFETEFLKSEKIGLVYSDAEVVDECLCYLGQTMWQRRGFDNKKQKAFAQGKGFDLLLTDGYFYGSSIAFLAVYRNLFLPFPTNTFFIHDNWIALMISAVAGVSIIEECLILYRQHSSQSVGILKNDSNRNSAFNSLKRNNSYNETINQLDIAKMKLEKSPYSVKKSISKINKAKKHILMRANLPKKSFVRFFTVNFELMKGNYHRYYNGFRSAMRDILG